MKVLDAGHVYVLENDSKDVSELKFIKRENGELVWNGVQNDEVLKVLIDRMYFLQSKMPCRENAIIITKLEEALMWTEARTKKRVAQGVETKDIPHK